MKKLFNIIFICGFGGLGWWLGGDSIGAAFGLSTLGSILGVVVAWKVNQLAGR